jgi:DNA-binding transcriptional MerR regulator
MKDHESQSRHLIRIGDLARATGKTTRAIHLYEELELLRPVTRSSGGFRLYDSSAVQRVRWIDSLHGLGFSLQEMRQILQSWWGEKVGPVAMTQLRELFGRKLAETRSTIERHQQLERELVESLRYLETCRCCDPPRPTSDCSQCPQDHRMETEPALVAGLYSGADHGPRRTSVKPGFVRAEEIGRGRSSRPALQVTAGMAGKEPRIQ